MALLCPTSLSPESATFKGRLNARSIKGLHCGRLGGEQHPQSVTTSRHGRALHNTEAAHLLLGLVRGDAREIVEARHAQPEPGQVGKDAERVVAAPSGLR